MGDEHGPEGRVKSALAHSESDRGLHWLEPIYREHSRALLRTAYRITGSASDAEDVLHTVFLRLARREEAPDLSRGALPYLRRAAVNAALDVLASRRDGAPDLDDVAATVPDASNESPERRQHGRELTARLRAALARIGGRGAEMFALRYFEEIDNHDIARLFDTSPGTVAVTLHRIRTRLWEELAPLMGGIQ